MTSVFKKTLFAGATALTLAAGIATVPASADARGFGGGHFAGGGVAGHGFAGRGFAGRGFGGRGFGGRGLGYGVGIGALAAAGAYGAYTTCGYGYYAGPYGACGPYGAYGYY